MRRAVAALFIALALALAAGVSGPAPWSAPAPAAASQAAPGAAIEPFTIDVPDSVLADLRERLARARMPDEPEGVGWQLGMNQAYLRQLVDYWRDEFDWRAQERRLNRLEQFKTTIDGLDIHFVHRRSAEPDAFPLILSHGWPGTFAEFDKVIEPLTDPVAHGGRAEGRLPRRRPVHPRLRVLGPAAAARLRPRPHRGDLRRADGASGLRTVRRARGRPRRRDQPVAGRQRRRARGRPAPQPVHRRPARPRQPPPPACPPPRSR